MDIVTENPQEIPYGFCQCGCGQPTPPTTRSYPKKGIVKGQPALFITGHRAGTGQRVDKTCEICGKQFQVLPTAKGRLRYCSYECYWSARRSLRILERFWSHVKKTEDGCWLWTGTIQPDGYGAFSVGGHSVPAHRVAYELKHGPIPAGMNVCHRCDVRNCVNNEAHLFAGTQADNMSDMTTKQRQARGERAARAKLTDEQVRNIHVLARQGCSMAEIALRYGVHHDTIQNILSGRTWKHLR